MYRYVSRLDEFINLAINFDDWYRDYINDETNYYIKNIEDFIESYGFYISSNLEDIKKIIPNISKENYKQVILDIKNKQNSNIDVIIKMILKDVNDYKQWIDHFITVYGTTEELIFVEIKDQAFKVYLKHLVDKYCSSETFNKNFKKLYKEDHDKYSKLLPSFF